MAPLLLKRQMSTLLNKLSLSDSALSTQALLLSESCREEHVQQSKASGDWNVPQHHMALFEVLILFMQENVFTRIEWPILSDDKYSMYEAAWKLAIQAQDLQWALAGASVGTPSGCQLLSGPFPKINLHS